jgi:DNA invertase Pin-like site-specific DNA recombinase
MCDANQKNIMPEIKPFMIGYARISTHDQDLSIQQSELTLAGCKKIFSEKITGTSKKRPELENMLNQLRQGDIVTVTRLDRLARNTRDLLEIAEKIQNAGAGMKSLAEPWADTTTASGHMVLTIFAGVAEFEHNLIVERTHTGRIEAKKRGVKFGPPRRLTQDQIDNARHLIEEKNKPVSEVSKLLGVHRSTIYRSLGHRPIN